MAPADSYLASPNLHPEGFKTYNVPRMVKMAVISKRAHTTTTLPICTVFTFTRSKMVFPYTQAFTILALFAE